MAPRVIYQSQLRVPVGQAPTVGRTDVSSGLMAVAEAKREEENRQRAAQLNEAELGMAREFSDAREELRRTDWREKGGAFETRASEIKARHLDAIRDPRVKASAKQSFDRLYLSGRDHTRQDTFEGERDHNIAETQAGLEQFAKDAAAARSPDERRIAIENGTKALANLVDAGFMDETRANDMAARFKGQADLFTAEKLAGDNPGVALRLFGNQAEAQKRFPALDPREILRLKDQAEREVKQREAEAKANAAQARAEAAVDAAGLAQSDIMSRQLTGKGVTDPQALATIRAGMTEKQFEKYQAAAQRADGVFKATGDMRAMPQAEIQAHVESLKPKGGEADFADRQAAYDAGRQIASNIVSARRADPALAAREAFTGVRDKWSFYEAKPNKEHLRDAIKATLAAQEAMGIPANQRAPMPHGMAIAIAGGIKGAKPENAAKELQAAAEQFGSYWPQAFKQMSKHLDGHARVAATVVDQKEAALLIEGSRQSVAALRKANGVKDGDDGIQRAAAEDPRVADLTVSLSQRAGGSGTATQLIQSIEVHALSRMRVYGEDQSTATEHAIQKIVGDRYDFARTGGQAFRVPKTAGDVSAIEAGARGVRQSVDLADVDMPDVPPGAAVEPLKQSYIAAIRRNGYWVTNDDETGAILYNERGVPVTKGGKPVAATWDELQRGEGKAPWRAFEAFR